MTCLSEYFPLCHAAGPPLSFPPVSPITNVGDKVSGNPVSCFFVLLFVWACMGKDLDSRLTTSGMTEGGLEGVGRWGDQRFGQYLLFSFEIPDHRTFQRNFDVGYAVGFSVNVQIDTHGVPLPSLVRLA